MISFIKYSEQEADFTKSVGANQGEWIICDSSSDVEFIAAKDAAPCLLIFMHGCNLDNNTQYASVAHISVAEKIESLSAMVATMKSNCSSVKISLISGISKLNSEFVKEIFDYLCDALEGDVDICCDLGAKTSKAVMEVKTGAIWKQQDIPVERYGDFNPDSYFRAAILGIMNKDLKQNLKKSFDTTVNNKDMKIIPYRPFNALHFSYNIYLKEFQQCLRLYFVATNDKNKCIPTLVNH